MLYTERAHFYHRYKIRGIQNLIIYSLPERKEFYPEILNMLDESQTMTSTVLFSRFDQLRLERIVGSSAAKRMTKSDKSLFSSSLELLRRRLSTMCLMTSEALMKAISLEYVYLL